jgi:hypothetical protein
MNAWWNSLSDNAQWALIVVPIPLVIFAVFGWVMTQQEPLRQYEVTLGDGTKATCVVVQGVRAAGVTCIPHVVVGPDAEEGE